ncbi:hypothetical protein [Methanoplanus endosymbiosus]|uniref:Uncharacterized protein n=1 Tax=Methanoplanus endosymbiosus TaxID=33865 RepID=A0A9E7PS40_9EURY|nr:hypothetical protein [Methanoplanus endosymbiosus]UUX92632.1 hypothetical protein L6E24_00455 [Methanoplanus endosymbiosus]
MKNLSFSWEFYTGIVGEEIELDLGKSIGFKGGLAIWGGYYAKGFVFGINNSGVGAAGSAEDAALSNEGNDGDAGKEVPAD